MLDTLSARYRQHASTLKAERRRLLRMGLPLIGAQMLSVGNGVVDTLVAGQLDAASLGAVGIGANLLFITLIACIGLLGGLSPLMARQIGAGKVLEVGALFRQGLWLALALAVITFIWMTLLRQQLHRFGFDPALTPLVSIYLDAARWCLLPALLLLVPRNVCEATGRTRPVLLIQAAGLLINIVSDLGLGLGYFGLPKLGLAGIAWSTTFVNLGMCLLIFWRVSGTGFRRFRLFAQFDWPNGATLLKLLGLSLPICLSLLFETGLFAAVSIQMGQLGITAASAHNIAITVCAFLFMVPLGLSLALTARLSAAYGREQGPSIFLRSANGVMVALVIALCTAATLTLFRHIIPVFFTTDPSVRQLAASLLLLGALFQMSDVVQVVLLGLLRGLHDTRVPMFITGVSYWIFGFGTALYASRVLDFGPHGLWMGLIVGLSVSALLLSLRLRFQLGKLNRSLTADPATL